MNATTFDASQLTGSDKFRYGVLCDAIAVHERENTPDSDYTYTRLREMRDAIELGHTVASRSTEDDGVPAERLPNDTNAVSRRTQARATEPQLARIGRELKVRDLANATAHVDRLIDQANEGSISKRDASELIDWLNGQPNKPGSIVRVATPKQIEWIRKEYPRRQLDDIWTDLIGKLISHLDAGNQIDRKAAGAALDQLFAAPYKPRNTAASTKDELTDGMYQLADGAIYKVQIAKNGSGRLYAKRLVVHLDATYDAQGKVTRPAEASFEYERGALHKLSPADKMSLEAAKQFGALYGVCCNCARPLTDEKSIAEGIGPICAEKM